MTTFGDSFSTKISPLDTLIRIRNEIEFSQIMQIFFDIFLQF